MEVIHRSAPRPGRILLLMLPGAYSEAQDFERQAFVEDLRRRTDEVDVRMVGAHIGHVTEKTVLQRLRQDVLEPARTQGYQRIWALGISLGGFVSLMQAVEDEPVIEGAVVLAPYLGPRSVYAPWLAMPAAQRMAFFEQQLQPRMPRVPPGSGSKEEDAALLQFWARLALQRQRPSVWMGWGLDDRFAKANSGLSENWPADRRLTAPGDHDWPAWRALWQQWLRLHAGAAWGLP